MTVVKSEIISRNEKWIKSDILENSNIDHNSAKSATIH